MQKKPIIGIASGYIRDRDNAGWHYYATREQDVAAVVYAGGTPLLIPPVFSPADAGAILESLDGLYLAGGGDVSGAHFGQEGNPFIQGINPKRDECELTLARLARRLGKATLGICRGCQVLNVAAGGSLVVDIQSANPSALRHHTDTTYTDASHPVTLIEGTHLASIYASRLLTVNSHHHQAVNQPGDGLTVSAHAPDGTIEGIEDKTLPFYLGVQWHPERARGNQEGIEIIFSELVKAAQQFHTH
jgi:putative glutamine amidotransferase